ncbi:hypothetical protein DEU56DRAFT_135302 [Suillus clintonianus]|uniref:uncharacterized protein n=1 Tax=Suillus clintonianus TaxID=1904413 RepID=UPI001B883B8B|nr:uncharacterized protein DEU56DRAFT_135302 [Suillus clintonianus]KAG2119291.1 hypothetical protein DEU56DRAFT_135302 [Suillus clintonianus]
MLMSILTSLIGAFHAALYAACQLQCALNLENGGIFVLPVISMRTSPFSPRVKVACRSNRIYFESNVLSLNMNNVDHDNEDMRAIVTSAWYSNLANLARIRSISA